MQMPELSAPVKERYWEIDAIRGLSLVAMIVFHTIFILGVFHIIDGGVWIWICSYIPIGTSVFVIISGVSLILRHGRMSDKPRGKYYLAIVKRGVEVFFIGVCVALIGSILIKLFINDGNYMYFNFLQMMGVSMILSIPFLRLGKWNIIPALFFMFLALFLKTLTGPIWLMPLGIIPADFFPRDFFPIIPWLGVMLLGVAIGSVLYPKGYRRFHIRSAGKIGSTLSTIGKYPLQVYIVHIPFIGLTLIHILIILRIFGITVGYI
jgi:uncharacterized membrane protein